MHAKQILELNRPAIEGLCRKYGVAKLRLFGSSLTAEWDASTSDFDFVAEFHEPPVGINKFQQLFGLLVDLEGLLDHKVDLVDWKAAKKPHFREQVDAEAVTWYAA